MLRLHSIPIFKTFNEASVYAHENWDDLPSNATDLKRVLRKGNVDRWKKFLKARRKFQDLRKSVSNKIAFESVYKAYKIRLRSVKPWKSTEGTFGLRKGPIEPRKRKTGPKSKASSRTVKSVFQFADRNSTATNQEIADHTNLRLSQMTATDEELSQ